MKQILWLLPQAIVSKGLCILLCNKQISKVVFSKGFGELVERMMEYSSGK